MMAEKRVGLFLLRTFQQGNNGQQTETIRAFWIKYFRAGGAVDVVFATDGSGQLAEFMSRPSSARK
jgi:hypothetical protein